MAHPFTYADNIKFAEELAWCINQLELGLENQNPESRQAADTIKIIKVLKSTKAPMVKKRQAMRNALGDYRKKMKDAEKKSLSGMQHSKFVESTSLKAPSGSRFLRHSHTQQSRNNLDSNLNSLHIADSYIDITTTPSLTSISSNQVEKGSPSISKIIVKDQERDKPTEKHSNFHFVPSNNSFSFSFGAIQATGNALEKEAEKDEFKPKEETDAINAGEVKSATNTSTKNFFNFEKSENSFSFGFNGS